MFKQNICIIGFGSRGLSVFERMIGFAKQALPQQLHLNIHIIDSGEPGVGIHNRHQPDYLLLNTPCGQLTAFTDESVAEAGPINPGPNLFQWVRESGYRLADDGFTLIKEGGQEIQANNFLPRKLLGEYLKISFEFLKSQRPENLSLYLHRQNAIRYERDRSGKAVISLENCTRIQADYVFLTTGHTLNITQNICGINYASFSEEDDQVPTLINEPYPVIDKLKNVEPKDRFGLCGLGLCALDVIAELTLGRGGYFTTDAVTGYKQYIPSGKEPVIFLNSRSGLPYRARPVIEDVDKSYQAALFTETMIDQLRSQKRRADGSTQLDFRHDVLPLLFHEMRLVYYQRITQITGCGIKDLPQAFIDSYNEGTIEQLTNKLATDLGPAALENHVFYGDGKKWLDSIQYQNWYLDFVDTDLQQARAGRYGSPLKDTLELFRDLRGVIRYIVDYGGLTPQSHKEFMRTFVSLMNRIVGGPSIKQNLQLLALAEAGIVRIPFGPSPNVRFNEATGKFLLTSSILETPISAEMDWLCLAHVKPSTVERSTSPLIQSLYRGNYVQPYYNGDTYIGGIHLDRNLQPINSQGYSERGLWVLGPLSEGVKYYNHYVASPLKRSQSQIDAGFCVKQMFTEIETKIKLISGRERWNRIPKAYLPERKLAA